MTRPWKRPNKQMRKNILKKERKTYVEEVARRRKASKVEMPPLRTAGPIFRSVFNTLASLIFFINNFSF